MTKQQQHTTETQKRLFSGDNDQIIAAINDIRKNGNLPIISSLLELLATNNNKNIQNAIISCISDIKNPLAAPIFIDALSINKFANIKNHILYSMWQSTIDYSKYADNIIEIIKNNNFETLIEAITVLENIASNIDNNTKQKYQQDLATFAKKSASPTKELIEQTIKMLAETQTFTDSIDIEKE